MRFLVVLMDTRRVPHPTLGNLKLFNTIPLMLSKLQYRKAYCHEYICTVDLTELSSGLGLGLGSAPDACLKHKLHSATFRKIYLDCSHFIVSCVECSPWCFHGQMSCAIRNSNRYVFPTVSTVQLGFMPCSCLVSQTKHGMPLRISAEIAATVVGRH